MKKMRQDENGQPEAQAGMPGAGAPGAGMPGAARAAGLNGASSPMTEEQMEEGAERAVEATSADQTAAILDLTNDLQRTRADFENFRRRVEERQEATKQAAKLATVFKLLPLLDDLGRAIGTYKELGPLKKSLDKTLNELGLKLVPAEAGEEFNPDYHDAVSVEGEGSKEVVAEVLRDGYYYGDELLRPAMVKVKRTE